MGSLYPESNVYMDKGERKEMGNKTGAGQALVSPKDLLPFGPHSQGSSSYSVSPRGHILHHFPI